MQVLVMTAFLSMQEEKWYVLQISMQDLYFLALYYWKLLDCSWCWFSERRLIVCISAAKLWNDRQALCRCLQKERQTYTLSTMSDSIMRSRWEWLFGGTARTLSEPLTSHTLKGFDSLKINPDNLKSFKASEVDSFF